MSGHKTVDAYNVNDYLYALPLTAQEIIDQVGCLHHLTMCKDEDFTLINAMLPNFKKLGKYGYALLKYISETNSCYRGIEINNLWEQDDGKMLTLKELEALGYPASSASKHYPYKEIANAIEKLKFTKAGFFYFGKSLMINPNIFSMYFHAQVRLHVLENEQYILYHMKGSYNVVNNIFIDKLSRDIMNDACPNSWKVSFENEVLRAILLSTSLVNEIDANDSLLNFKNCILDLETSKVMNHSPDYLLTNQLDFEYDPKAEAPKFRLFMEQVSNYDKDLERVLQESLGDLLLPNKKSEKTIFWRGLGKNGKSVLSKLLCILVGERNVTHVPISQFNEKFGLQTILGKKLNIANENELNGKTLDTEKMKAISSGDRVTINIKYKNSVDVKLGAKLLFLVNSLPPSSDVTYGFIRKILIIPFNNTFTGDRCDPDIFDKLTTELSGIFNYILEGMKRLKENHYVYSESDEVNKIMRSYILSINPVFSFIDEVVTIDDENQSVSKKEMIETYISWCQENAIDIPSGRGLNQSFWSMFKNACAQENITYKEKKVKGYHHLKGFGIKEEYMLKKEELIIA